MVIRPHKLQEEKTLEDIAIEQLRAEVNERFADEGLSKEVVQKSISR